MTTFLICITIIFGVPLSVILVLTGVRILYVGEDIYRIIQGNIEDDYVLDLWCDYLACNISKSQLHQELITHLG